MGKEENIRQDMIEMKLLTPLTGDFFQEDRSDWEDDFADDWETLDGRELAQYEDAIQKAVDRENHLGTEDGSICNLMDYFRGSHSIKEKVGAAVVCVESAEGILYGCTTLQLKEYLESGELQELCEYITGQYSDGWGEGFEQRDIQVEGGVLNVHFWQGGNQRFRVQAAEEKKPVPENGKAAGPPCPQEKKPRPRLQLMGHDGNIFSVLGDAVQLLTRNGQRKEADEMSERVFGAGGYYEALGIISEYVETELSSTREKKNQGKQGQRKGPCR